MRSFMFCGLLLSLITMGASVSEAMPPYPPTPCPQLQSPASSPRPIARSVQVNVPAPCPPPPPCGYGNPCRPPSCVPPSPTRPVNVRVEVVVRPEAKKPCLPQRFCCENPPVFEPYICRTASMLRSVILAPLAIGERFLGHGCPRLPCPPPTPIACHPWPAPACAGFVNTCPPPMSQCMPRCVPSARSVRPAPWYYGPPPMY